MADIDARRRKLWELQDFSRGRGLEIGPLHAAILGRDRADVRYVDIVDQAGLRAHYADHQGITVEDIPEIDYPLTQPDGRIVSLAEASRSGAPFEWVVASHVIEHVPDVIGWLGDLAEVVADGGAVVLVVPDRRYCFDVHRPPTSVGAMLEAHLTDAVRPGVRAVYDHHSRAVQYDVVQLWEGLVPSNARRHHSLELALEKVEESLTTYVDCHVWLWSPESFLEQLHELRLIGHSQWYVDTIMPTPRDQIEFMVRLRRLPRDRSGEPEPVVDGEQLPRGDRPDWLSDPGRTLRVEGLEGEVARLEDKLGKRAQRLDKLGRRLERKEKRIERQQRRIAEQRRRIERQQRRIAEQRRRIERQRTELEAARSSRLARAKRLLRRG